MPFRHFDPFLEGIRTDKLVGDGGGVHDLLPMVRTLVHRNWVILAGVLAHLD